MARIVLQVILPLLAPVIIYGLWSYFTRKRQGKGLPGWEEGHWFYAVMIGFVLAFGSFGYLAATGFERELENKPPARDIGPVESDRFR